jgi:clumping factor B
MVPSPTTVAPAAPSFLESDAELTVDADAEAEADADMEAETEADAEADSDAMDGAEVDLDLDKPYQDAAFRADTGADPIARLKASMAARRFAASAQWADKFDAYTTNLAKSDRAKRIADMRAAVAAPSTGGYSLLETGADADADADADEEADEEAEDEE